MKRWLKFRDSIFIKFSIAFLVVGLIPLFIISYSSIQAIKNEVERQTENQVNQMVLYLSLNMEETFKKYNEISKMMYFGANEYINPLRTNFIHEENDNERIIQLKINEFLRLVTYSDQYIESAIFVRHIDQKVFAFSRTNKRFDLTKFPIGDWMQPLMEQPKQLAVLPPHHETYFHNSRNEVIIVGRNLVDLSDSLWDERNIIGTLFIGIDTAVFHDLLKEVKLGENDNIFVLDSNGHIFLSTRDNQTGLSLSINHSDSTIISERTIPFTNGKVISINSKTDVISKIMRINNSVILVIAICVLALFIMSIFISKKFSKPILVMMKQMKKIESGNLDVRVPVESKDEMGKLARGFNQMVDRLKAFINDAYIAEIKQKQTELNALKSQIRPHYLYNTLEVIRMSAVNNDDNEVADMIHVLSNQMKYVIDYGEEMVTIETELNHLYDYFKLIKVRFEDKVNLVISIDPEVSLDWGIHKLSLQPVVENAILHGIRPKLGNGVVQVIIEKKEDEVLVVSISDDGVGMSEDIVNKLNLRLSEGYVSTNKSIGMWNVNERIKAHGNKRYGLEIQSKPNEGTTVRMVVPVVREVK